MLYRISLRHKGVVPRRETRAEGLPDWVVDDRVRAGVLVVLHDGVYRHAAVPYTQDLRWMAAVLACGDDAVLSHRAAAVALGFPSVRRVRPEVTTPHTDLPLLQGVDVHRTVRLRPFERAVVRGIPVTSRGKTALDLCAVMPFHLTSEIISEAIVMNVVKPEAVLSTLERSTGRGVRGTTDLRRIAASLDEIRGLESVLELRGWNELQRADIPTPVQQHEIVCDDGRTVRVDLGWPELRLTLDWDGKRWHGTPARRRRTRERHEAIEASGIRHLIFGWADVHDTPDEMRRAVEAEIFLRRQHAA